MLQLQELAAEKRQLRLQMAVTEDEHMHLLEEVSSLQQQCAAERAETARLREESASAFACQVFLLPPYLPITYITLGFPYLTHAIHED